MTFSLSCNSETISAEVLTSSFSKTEVFYNKLKQADNSARFQCIFTSALSDFLKTNINNDIEVQIKDGTTDVFFGYVRKSVSFTKTQVNQPISIEVVSPSYFLEKKITYSRAYMDKTLEETLLDLLEEAGVEAIGTTASLSYKPKIITVEKDSDYKSVITELLYEYGYTWDFDNSGYFQIYNMFDIPQTSAITNTFDGTNCVEEITIEAKERECDSVRATYNNVTEYQDALIFRDTSNADSEGAGTCLQPVNAGEYFAGEKYNYLETDSDKGNVVWIDSIRSAVTKDSNSITWDARCVEMDSTKANYGKPLGTQICFTAKNNDTSNIHNLTKIDFYGHVYIATSEVEVKSYGERKAQEITLSYVCDKTKAEAFASMVSAWYRFANNEINVKSATDYALGSFVKVTDAGIGTYYGRIIKKVYKLNTSNIEYVIETVEEYTPASLTDESRPSAGGIYGAMGSTLKQANDYTTEAITSATMQASPIYSAVFNSTVIKKGTDGGYSPSNISARGRALTGDNSEEMYSGIWKIYINNQVSPAVTVSGSSVNLTVDELMSAGGVDDLTTVSVEFYAANGVTLIDTQYIPVLTGAAAYAVILDNPFQTYEADENGAIGERTVTAKARVFYGLQELEYLAEDGWEYGAITTPEGFSVSVDVETGVISITALEGSSMADAGRIEIPVFLHSQTNTEYFFGYTSDARTAVDYYFGYDNKFFGYLTPDENGYYYTYFNFQKLTKTAIKLAALNTKVDGYWSQLTDDLKITMAEKETLRILLNSVQAEYQTYTARYSNHTKYSAYQSAYNQLNTVVSDVLAYTGVYTFNDEAQKSAFNQKFSNYYTAKGNLDAEIASTSTNYGGLSEVSAINDKTPKPTDYFIWLGETGATVGTTTLTKGLVYCWNGSAWVEDTDNSHLMNTMSYAFEEIRGSSDETIPAVSFAKQLIALKVVTDSLAANFATINFLEAGEINATNMHLSGNSTVQGRVDANAGNFENVEIKHNCKVEGTLGYSEIFNSEDFISSGKFEYAPVRGTDIIVVYRGYKYTDYTVHGEITQTEYKPVAMITISSKSRYTGAITTTHVFYEVTAEIKTIWQSGAYPSFTKKTRNVSGQFATGTEEYFEVKFSSLGTDFGGCKFSHLTMN